MNLPSAKILNRVVSGFDKQSFAATRLVSFPWVLQWMNHFSSNVKNAACLFHCSVVKIGIILLPNRLEFGFYSGFYGGFRQADLYCSKSTCCFNAGIAVIHPQQLQTIGPATFRGMPSSAREPTYSIKNVTYYVKNGHVTPANVTSQGLAGCLKIVTSGHV